MAKKVENDKRFLVLEVTAEELKKVGGLGICDECNQFAESGYYVAVLNHYMCQKCYNEFMSRAINYPEDAEIEIRNYDYMCDALSDF